MDSQSANIEVTTIRRSVPSRQASVNRNLYWFTGVPGNAALKHRMTEVYPRSMPLTPMKEGVETVKTVDNDDIPPELNARTLLSGFADFTTAHGIPHVYKSSGLVKRLIWVLLSLGAHVMLALHLWVLITSYITFETTTTITITEERLLKFPAVTICNNNGMMKSKLPVEIDDLVESRKNNSLGGSNVGVASLFKRISEKLSTFSESRKIGFGQSLRDFMLYCYWEGDPCNYTHDFYSLYDSTYGNCFTFNSGKFDNYALKYTSTAGVNYGLTLIMNIDVEEYVSYLTEDSGVRVVLHDQGAMPFPDRQGLSASPGLANQITAKRVILTRQGNPYGNCTPESTVNSPINNAYFQPYAANYTQSACLNTCYQAELVQQCGCFDSDVPYLRSNETFVNLTNTASQPCLSSNSVHAACKNPVKERFMHGGLKCEHCFQLCNEVRYETSKSISIFPADSYMNDFVSSLKVTHPDLVRYYNTSDPDDIPSVVKSNVVKVNVFYDNLEYTTLAEVASYDQIQFFSDVGGTVGLWVGWSLLTIFEFLQLIFDLFFYCFYKTCKKD